MGSAASPVRRSTAPAKRASRRDHCRARVDELAAVCERSGGRVEELAGGALRQLRARVRRIGERPRHRVLLSWRKGPREGAVEPCPIDGDADAAEDGDPERTASSAPVSEIADAAPSPGHSAHSAAQAAAPLEELAVLR
jgi:hypothetical protein